MAEGVQNPNVVLSIGFLNSKIEENLETYKVSSHPDILQGEPHHIAFYLSFKIKILAK